MSFIVRGIDLPSKDQSPLLITVWADGVICSVDSNGGIEETTSAIQIPKGHGDIKDVSDLIKAIDHAHDNVWNRDDWLDENMRGLLRDTKKRIEKLPTILEAESEEQNEMPI